MPLLSSTVGYIVHGPGGTAVHVINHSLVNVNDLAADIWCGQRNLLRLIRGKTIKTSDAGADGVFRVPPMMDAIYVPIDDVQAWFTGEWRLRSLTARATLSEYDFEGFAASMVKMHKSWLVWKRASIQADIDDMQTERQRLQEEIDGFTRQ